MKPSAEPAASIRQGNYKWALVAMLWFICFFNYADRQAISSVLPELERQFGFTKAEQGIIAGAFMWVYGLSAPLAGMVGDRANRKLVILAGLYVWSLITGLTALCQKTWQFAFVRGAEGLGETFYFPASMSLVSEYHGPETRSRAMSLHQTSVYAGIIGGGYLTGLLADRFGWQFPFIAFGLGGIVLGLVLARFVREPGRASDRIAPGHEPGGDVQESAAAALSWRQFAVKFLTTPASLTLLLGFVGANTVAGVFYVWMPTYIKTKFHYDLATSALVGTVFIQLASMVGSVTGGVLADAWRTRWLGGRVGVQGLGIVIGTPMILLSALANQLPLVIAGMIGLGFCKGVYDSNIWPAIYEVVPAGRRSSAVGMANLVGWCGAGVGSWQLGKLVDGGFSMSSALGLTAILYVVVAGLLWSSALVFTPREIRRAQLRQG